MDVLTTHEKPGRALFSHSFVVEDFCVTIVPTHGWSLPSPPPPPLAPHTHKPLCFSPPPPPIPFPPSLITILRSTFGRKSLFPQIFFFFFPGCLLSPLAWLSFFQAWSAQFQSPAFENCPLRPFGSESFLLTFFFFFSALDLKLVPRFLFFPGLEMSSSRYKTVPPPSPDLFFHPDALKRDSAGRTFTNLTSFYLRILLLVNFPDDRLLI